MSTAAAVPAVRVVSLVPSITETLLSWGVRPVAVTRFCEAPGVETVGGTKNPDVEKIIDLRPDVVLMDREENRAPDAARLAEAGLRVLATDVRSLSDVQEALIQLARAAGAEPPKPPDPTAAADRPAAAVAVWVPIWRRPWMSIGGATYGSSLLAAAGLDNVCAGAAAAYPQIEPSEAARLGARFVLAPSEPYKFSSRHLPELEAVAPVVFVDGQDLFWWGTRTTGALERLRSLGAELAGG